MRQDTLVDILLKSVQAFKNQAKIRRSELEPEQHKEQVALLEIISKDQTNLNDIIAEIARIIQAADKSDEEKLREIKVIVNQNLEANNNAKNTSPCKQLNKLLGDDKYYDYLEEHVSLLRSRVSEIIKTLEFDKETSSKNILDAIHYYKENDGDIEDSAPTDFLENKEIKVIINEKNNFRPKLYKAFFYIHIASAIKSGHLNLKYSYRYKSIQGYLIEKETWEQKRESLLAAAGLEDFSDVELVLGRLKSTLDNAYSHANKRIENDDNSHIRFTSTETYILNTPKLEKKNTGVISDLLFEGGFVPIIQVLRDVDKSTRFTESFKHYSIKHHKLKPDVETIIAGIMAQGHNLGINKISNISVGINSNTLRQVVTWFFTQENLQAANNKIISLINKLALSKIYKYLPHLTTTSSDGQKYHVAVDSLLANYSYKYFGKDKGITVYTFIDDSESLFYSTVMSASEREAPYVIDGLLHNDVVKSSIHSTDMHGFTESIFATTHFMGTSFAPRLKNLNRQQIYAFSAKSTYAKKGYKILPSRTINTKLITEHWDDILRFMATIKLKETTASQLFKRLSSYAKDHPLYQAIKEFGRIIKSQFILTYIDEVELRQRIEKQLSRIELSNKFAKAVFFDKSHEFKVASPEEQQDIVACKTLIQNSIVLWNYLYYLKEL